MREHMESQIKPIIEMVARMSFYNQEAYENSVKEYEENTGSPFPEKFSYEQMKEFVQEGNYKISIKREYLISIELKVASAIENSLHQRSWRLFRTTATSGDYVTSDHPVSLIWNNGRKDSPGFLVPDTTVVFPLAKDLILVGDFEGNEGIFDAKDNMVAMFNSNTIMNSVERVFAPDKNFYFFDNKNNLEQGKKLV